MNTKKKNTLAVRIVVVVVGVVVAGHRGKKSLRSIPIHRRASLESIDCDVESRAPRLSLLEQQYLCVCVTRETLSLSLSLSLLWKTFDLSFASQAAHAARAREQTAHRAQDSGRAACGPR